MKKVYSNKQLNFNRFSNNSITVHSIVSSGEETGAWLLEFSQGSATGKLKNKGSGQRWKVHVLKNDSGFTELAAAASPLLASLSTPSPSQFSGFFEPIFWHHSKIVLRSPIPLLRPFLFWIYLLRPQKNVRGHFYNSSTKDLTYVVAGPKLFGTLQRLYLSDFRKNRDLLFLFSIDPSFVI